ncbi:hypothetical protein CORMATOL_02958 [Corynebacterium matruchotii ATCC 33806]|uniref:Uncharacterized protein n=1 Tax=Corynebacterium matruchotii ATCC 33806 TaxID=566549 RepID=C0E7G9_9CORY|nr:hypothetical protein CORMATOL_02958 [Corynebacterium matruchotii ATCC 33806]
MVFLLKTFLNEYTPLVYERSQCAFSTRYSTFYQSKPPHPST